MSSGILANHHLGGFDDRDSRIAPFELQLANGIASNDRGQDLVANAQSNLCKQSVRADFVDNAAELIAAAEGHQYAVSGGLSPPFRWFAAGSEQAIDFIRGHAVMAALGANRADRALMDPPLHRGIGDAKLLRRVASREKVHCCAVEVAAIRATNRAKSY